MSWLPAVGKVLLAAKGGSGMLDAIKSGNIEGIGASIGNMAAQGGGGGMPGILGAGSGMMGAGSTLGGGAPYMGYRDYLEQLLRKF